MTGRAVAVEPAVEPTASGGGTVVDTEHLLHLRHALVRDIILSRETTGRPGGFASRVVGNGLDIREIRPLSEGDDFRHIDAMTTARTGRLHVRTFFDDRDRTSLLVADFRRPMFWGTRRRLKSVAAAETLALLGWRDVLGGCRIGLMTVSDALSNYCPPRTGERGMAMVAGGLALGHTEAMGGSPPQSVRPLSDILERAVRIVPRGATVCLATGLDIPGEGFAAAVHELSRRARLVIVRLQDAFERNPAAGSYAYFSNDPAVRRIRVRSGRLSHDGTVDAIVSNVKGAVLRTIDTETDISSISRILVGWDAGPNQSRP